MLDIRRLEKLVADSNNKVNVFHSRERFFGFPETEYEEVSRITREFQPYADLWSTVYEWTQWEKKWQVEPFSSIDPDQMEKDITSASKRLFKSINAFKESPEVLAIANQTQQQLSDFKPHIPLIQALRNPGMRARHWTELSDRLGFKFQPQDSKLTLQDLLKMNLHEHFEEIAKIADTAGKEYIIESTLDKMEKEWADKVFTIVPYKDTGTYILKNPDDIAQLLDDHLVTTGSMSFSVYKKAFETRMAKWEATLSLVADILDAWLMVQKQWLYLEPIFSSDDIHKQMPTEGKRFVTMDRNWRTIMQRAFAVPKVLEFANSKKLHQTFQECNKLLELVQKGLSEYLESKCAAFPRFYFLSNEDLLQILSQSKDPTAVQPHLSKCFENIQKLQFQSDLLITDMFSAEGEKIEFIKKFYPKGNVEHWLLEVESTMKKSIREEILKGLNDYSEETRAEWVLRWPGQVILCASQVKWTKLVTDSILAGPQAMKQLYEHQLKQLDDLTKLVRGELPYLSRLSLGSLIVMDVHARDVVANLISSNVTSDKEFEWMSQLRYYWEDDDILVKIVNGVFRYGYEYLGNTTRLVITPLTDRCYTTLTGALHVQLGGAPQGPAGTGKTETTKDLAKALAKKCVVFNCSEGLNYLAMEKFFKGIASSGSWSCFDEFNRIELEVLSVIAQQILSIQRAIQGKLKRFIFEGTEIGLDPTCATFITMNPGYAGRTELPDNLKALFRPVAMMVPDYSMIAEISLFSFGFSNASILARKMVATFKLCSEQLSSQGHYDFGMRSVKTVISAAGNLKRQYPTMREELILLRALRDVNMPKFLSEDIPLFNGIISDLFPGVEEEPLDYAKLIGSLKETCAEMKLQPVDNFIQKCIQLYETTVVRHGVMLLGPAGGGKTTCYRVLSRAMTKLAQKNEKGFERVNVYVMNPKSVTMGQLYGDFVLTTHEFSDGILAKIVRDTAYEATPFKKWILLDGPVDANWIENMNTVLDDNKKLCLPQGEIITLSPTQTMMFETEDLLEASPATVSRCGMIYMEPADLGVEPLVFSWLEIMPPVMTPYKSLLQDLFNKFLSVSLKFIRRECREPVVTVDSNLSHSLMNILECFLADYFPDEESEEEQKPKVSFPENFELHMEYLFLFSLVWSVGGSVDTEGRKKFDGFLRDQVPKADIKAKWPEKGTVYEYCYDMKSGSWIGWLDTIPEFSISPTATYSEIIVPTMDTIRYTYLMDLLLKRGKHVLCAGPTGTGKSVAIVEKLTQGMPPEFIPIFINFSAQTKANQIQDILDAKFDKKRKGVVGPPTGRKYTIFIDDVNMPAKERLIGAQPPIELIRQWLDHGGWYDRKLLEFKKIVDINLIAAMGPPGGGRNHISMRFTRHFNLIYFTEIEDNSLRKMFGTILDNFLRSFSPDVKQLSGKLIEATIEVYNTIANELLPTPSKSHYTFNLRDLSKVFQGMLQVKHIEDIKGFLRLWAHECTRVFSDRLINDEDRHWFRKLLEAKMFKYLKITWLDIVPTESYRLLYGDFGVPNATTKIYQEINPNNIGKVMTDQLEYYNNIAEKPLNLVLFMDAIDHVTRISRIIRQPGGHALLLGIGGSGKQSLTRLAAAMADYSLFQIELSSTYGVNEWREDIKNILMQTGVEEKKIVFLFSDTQIVDKSFLEDINNMLNTGDVPNIFETEDIEKIAEVVGPVVQSLGLNVNKEIIYAHFLKRVKMNLHLVITMSPIGDDFRNRLRMFPSLVNCCTIDWFGAWPKDALISVAQKYLKDLPIEEELRERLVTMCMYIHQSVELLSGQYKDELNRHNYVTPTSYLELLSVFKDLMEKKKTELGTLRKRLQIGLDKLLDTTTEVNHLQAELTANRPLLEQANKDTEAAMEKIKLDKASADETRKVVMKEEAEANKQAEATQAIAEDAKKDLQEALPALESAESALKTLNKKDIFEVKSMVRPPVGVKMVMEAVCIVLAIKPKKIDGDKPGEKVDDYWEIAKSQLLTDPKFLDNLVNLNRDAIPETTIQKLQPYINSNDFRPIAISKVSKACTSLCLWVRAIEKYYHVAKNVAPKREKLKEAQQSLEKTMKALEEAKARLKGVEDSIAELERQFKESESKKEELTKKVKDCEEKLDRAHKLIGALADEKDRWIENIAELDKKLYNLVGDAILSAGVISYLGAFTPAYRSSAIRNWQSHLEEFKIPHTPNCNIVSVLGEAVKIRQWNIAGLPTDNHSIENAIMVHNSRRWPLMIDPQGQANKWIKKMEQDSGLDVIKLTNPGFVRTLENAIRFGKPVLLENVGEELEPVLDPVLLKQVFKQSGHDVIKIGESVIPYHDSFRFYITTKLPNPNYKPEISTKVSLLNFTLTSFGLEDQLLGLVVEKERPDLEEEKNSLVISNAQMKKEVKEIEDKILVLLATSKGNPLNDETLINLLAESKKTSQAIKKKMIESEEIERKIDVTRSLYRPVAVRACVLFFCIVDLSNIDHMYQYSLNWFLNLFTLGIANAKKSTVLEERLENLNKYFTHSLFMNVCRSLFENHKLLFSFLLCVKILENSNQMDATEWRYLLAGVAGATKDPVNQAKPAIDWVSDKLWSEIFELAKLPAFINFHNDFATNHSIFKAYFDSSDPHKAPLPEPWQSKLNSFQRLLILRCIRPDKMITAIQEYITEKLGPEFLDPPTFDLGQSFKDSSVTIPLIFVLSPGADPANDFMKFAEEMKFGRKYEMISLGQGQGPKAERMVMDAMERGTWVLLQNCHLAASWMSTLEKIVDSIQPEKVHRDFRLWLTSMPSDKFPVSVLQNSIKMTNEPPKGIKANLMRTYKSFDDSTLSIPVKQSEWCRLLFSLAFFHAIVQERRKFGPLGWNVPYEYNTSDFLISMRQLRMFLEEYSEVPYKLLRYLAGELNYGGRVTDAVDRKTLNWILTDFYNEDVIKDEYRFSTSSIYYNPVVDSLKGYIKFIKDLPINDPPEVFGLHDNAELSVAQQEAFNMFDNILQLQPRVSSNKGNSRDAQIADVAKSILDKLPQKLAFSKVSDKSTQEGGLSDSMTTVVNQEIVRYNRLLAVINRTLNQLLKAIKGLVVMSLDLDQLASSLFNNQVPQEWARSAYPSLKPLSAWVMDLEARLNFISNWARSGVPNVFWISGFFFPQAFLTGTLQNFARKYKISIDTVSFDFEVVNTPVNEITSPPPDGAYISGLFLEGARWDPTTNALADSHPKKLYEEMPIIWLKPTSNRQKPKGGFYECPMYKTLSRAGTLSTTGHSTNFVLSIEIPSDKEQKHWVKRGVALVCSLNY